MASKPRSRACFQPSGTPQPQDDSMARLYRLPWPSREEEVGMRKKPFSPAGGGGGGSGYFKKGVGGSYGGLPSKVRHCSSWHAWHVP
jgi:hypothetical protein